MKTTVKFTEAKNRQRTFTFDQIMNMGGYFRSTGAYTYGCILVIPNEGGLYADGYTPAVLVKYDDESEFKGTTFSDLQNTAGNDKFEKVRGTLDIQIVTG